MLLDPAEGVDLCIERLGRNPEAFHDIRHRVIYETMARMFDRGEPVDIVTLSQRLREHGQLESAGGMTYLAQLPDAVAAPASLEFYVEILREQHLRRRLLRACGNGVDWAFDSSNEVREILDRVEHEVLQINGDSLALPEGMRKIALRALARAELLRSHGGPTGIVSGFHDLDGLTGGFQAGEMIVIAARPSVGKTALAMSIAERVAVDRRLPVAVFSLEMSAESLALRLLCSRARINLANLRDGLVPDVGLERMKQATSELAAAPLYIDDTAGLSILEIKARARRLRKKHGIDLFIVDYLQLCRSDPPRLENRQQEIAEVSHGLKALAKELAVPVIVLSQLNRELEKAEKPRRPQLSDLRESGAIEQDADVVGLLYKWKEDAELAARADEPQVVHLLVAKHRNGPTGDICLTFLRSETRFENFAKGIAAMNDTQRHETEQAVGDEYNDHQRGAGPRARSGAAVVTRVQPFVGIGTASQADLGFR